MHDRNLHFLLKMKATGEIDQRVSCFTINLSQLFLDSRHSKIVNNKFRCLRIPDNDDGKVRVTTFYGQDML